MSIVFQWFLSGTVRHALDLRKHVLNLVAAQRDLLVPEGIAAIEAACSKLRGAVVAQADKKALQAEMTAVETVANQWLKPHPHASWRENVEVVLVAIGVAMAIRTFFLQPFKIPTGSMQPTLYGITHENFRERAEVKFPTGFAAFVDSWFRGVTYYHIVCEEDGEVLEIEQPKTVLPLVKKQRFQVGARSYTVWFPPDQFIAAFFGQNANRSGLSRGQQFRKGEDILKLKVISGDHLFVDRLSYNFRRPERGEIIVFETKGIPSLPQDQFYIKRMVAMGGERVRLGDDRHLRINGQRLDASTPRFENVYHLTGPPDDSKFSGHVNERVAQQYRGSGLAPLFSSEEAQEFPVRPRHYIVMGDNTMNSLDSRRWGDFAQENVIGKSAFVYWPFLSQGDRAGRFGWSHR